MDELSSALKALLVVAAANSTPVLASRLLGDRLASPMDFGWRLADGERLLGPHKTWRGFVSGVATSALAAGAVGIGAATGAAAGLLALGGDAASSAVKRRLRRAPGAEVPGLDQVPEALLPLFLLQRVLGLSLISVALITGVFVAADLASAPLRRRVAERAHR